MSRVTEKEGEGSDGKWAGGCGLSLQRQHTVSTDKRVSERVLRIAVGRVINERQERVDGVHACLRWCDRQSELMACMLAYAGAIE